jgi:ribosomal protein L10
LYSRDRARPRNPKCTGLRRTRAGKAELIEKFKVMVDKASMIMAVPHSNVKCNDLMTLRRSVPVNVSTGFVKRGFLRKCINGTSFEPLIPHLHGQNLYFFIPDGLYLPTLKAIYIWLKDLYRIEAEHRPTYCALEDMVFIGSKEIEEGCKMPSKRSLFTEMIGMLEHWPRQVISIVDKLADMKDPDKIKETATDSNNTSTTPPSPS